MGDDTNTSSSTRSMKNASSSASRRKHSARWDHAVLHHSYASLLSTMERFVQTVDDMNETILVPCRLMDMKFDQQAHVAAVVNENGSTPESKRLVQNLNGIDMFRFYSMLNSVRNDLMWGNKSQAGPVTAQLGIVPPPQTQNAEVKGHARRPSTVSTTSSTSASDTEFSELNEDSGVEAEDDYSQRMANSFHHHLNGLQHCLRDLTLAADYVTTSYNNDLGGGSI